MKRGSLRGKDRGKEVRLDEQEEERRFIKSSKGRTCEE